jgi:hypothetical protein
MYLNKENMLSHVKCFFPTAQTPLQKFACVSIGTIITGGSLYGTNIGMIKYIDYKNKQLESQPEPESEHEPEQYKPYKVSKIGTFMDHTFTLPFKKTNDVSSIALSLPFTGIYCFGQYHIIKVWYYILKDSFVNVKNTDQCCKLVRMSISGTVKHYILASGLLCTGYVTGLALYITSLNIHSACTNRKQH